MKRTLQLFAAAIAVSLGLCLSANGQGLIEGYPGGYPGEFSPSQATGAESNLVMPFWGPIDFSATGTAEGFGYEGSYVSAQTVIPLYTNGNGVWYIADLRGSVSENGGIFTNVGVLRRTHFKPMCADFGVGFYYDYDADEYEIFGHTFHQGSIHAHMYTQIVDIEANGYIPVGEEAYFFGTADNCFAGNSLLLQHGIDAALEGFDVTGTIRPPMLNNINGGFTFGGYAYQQQRIPAFGGFLGSFSFQPRPGTTVTAGIQTSESEIGNLGTAGFLTVAMNLGGSRGLSPTGQDLRAPNRKAHITRAHQDHIFVIDPDTMAPYRVVHVDNTNTDPGGGDGTFENPFAALASADGVANPGNSLVDDIIFVREGNAAYNDNIQLLTRQFLLGDGVMHIVPAANVPGGFVLCNDQDGMTPTINGDVTLANDNVVRGFTINGTTAAITANGQVGNTLTLLDEINITGGPTGVNINNSGGRYLLTDVDIMGTTANGFRVNGGLANLDVDWQGDLNVGAGNAILVSNTAAGSDVDVAGGTVTVTGGNGIIANNVGGMANITSPQNISNTGGPAISVLNTPGTGTVTFQDTIITDPAVAGVNVQNGAVGSTATFTNLAITDNAGGNNPVGVLAVGADNLNFFGANTVTVDGNAALQATNVLDIDGGFQSLQSDNSVANGVLLSNVNGNLGVTTTIVNNADNADSVLIQNDGTGLVANFTQMNITGAGNGNAANGLRINNTANSTTTINQLNSMTDNGNAVFLTNAGIVNILDGTLNANGGAGFISSDTELHTSIATVTSANSVTDGVNISGVANITGGAAGASTANFGSTTITDAANTAISISNIDDSGVVTELAVNFGNTTIDDTGANTDNGVFLTDNGDAATSDGEVAVTFNNLNIDVNNGAGFTVNDLANVAGETTYTVNFTGGGANVDSDGGPAINIAGGNGLTNGVPGWTFGTVSSMNTSNGVQLTQLNQDFIVTGTTTVNTASGVGISAQLNSTDITFNNVDIDNTNSNAIDVGIHTGTFAVLGGEVDMANERPINIANGGSNGNFIIDGVDVTLDGTLTNQVGIRVSDNIGFVRILNNSVDMSNATNSVGYFVSGTSPNGLNLGVGQSVNNTTANVDGTSNIFISNGNANIIGTIEIDGNVFAP